MPIILVPSTPAGAPGYYAPKALISVFAGDSFDREFNLRANEVVFDPDLLAQIQQLTDTLVNGICYEIGLDPDPTAPPPHYIATTSPIYGSLQLWGARWARAQGHLVRGEDSGGDADDEALIGGTETSGPGSIEGKMTRMRKEAERRIRDLITAYYERTSAKSVVRHPGILVGSSGCRGYYGIKTRGYWVARGYPFP